MDFSEQIKKLRAQNKLTQEQFASKLNVSRQAVSSWENGRNLPDLEMVVSISKEFGISLDDLILGGTEMKDKLIKDGSEVRKTRMNLILVLIGALLLIIGAGLIVIKGLSVEYIDSEGFLHENFFLLPIGFAFMFCGLMTFLAAGIRGIVSKLRNRKK